MQSSWYIFKCRHGFEIKAADELKRAGVGSYSPSVRKSVKRRRGATYVRVDVWRPLFVGYVLVEAPAHRLSGLCDLDYMGHALKAAGSIDPAPLPAGLVEDIRTAEEVERIRHDRTVNRARFRPGDKVAATVGRWGELTGTIRRLDSRGAIHILVRMLGSERVVKVSDQTHVELVEAAE